MIVPDPAEIQRYAEEVLRRPEFNAAQQKPRAPGWLQRALEWLAAHHVLPLINADLGTILLITAGAVIVAFLGVWLVPLIRSGIFLPGRPRRAIPGQPASVKARPPAIGDSLRTAALALAAGDARSAIQALLRACLDHLADLGAITLERWKTNTIYLRECPASLPSYDVFHDLAKAHNDIVYAHRSVPAGRIGEMMDALAAQVGTT